MRTALDPRPGGPATIRLASLGRGPSVVGSSIRHARGRDELERQVAARSAALQRALRALKDTQANLLAQERLASLGALTAGIAHEVRNPLNFIINFGEVNRELLGELKEGDRVLFKGSRMAALEKVMNKVFPSN